MANDAQSTLFHPFETGEIEPPGQGERVIFFGAEPGFRLPDGFGAELTIVQGFRPAFLQLRGERSNVLAEPDGDGYSMALVLAGKHRGLNEARIAEALRRVRDNCTILVAGAKDDGIASLRKRVGALAPLAGSVAKHHGVAFWMPRPADAVAVATMLEHDNRPALINDRFLAAPGMFSHDRIDAGSSLLAAHIPADLSGRVADFCAGWGYLACEVAVRCPKVAAIALYEADYASLEAAKRNVAANAPDIETRFFWHDLLGEPVAERYDVVVMNPPFHTGRAAEPGLGEALIRVAAGALKRGGQLFVVANRQLPYEAALGSAFSKVHKLAEEQVFKVFRAVR